MTRSSLRVAAFGIGIVAGLRSLTAPAVLVWTADKKIVRKSFPLAGLLSHKVTMRVVKLAAGELIADKLPFTPGRISTGPLAARLVSGAACGAAVSLSSKGTWQEGAVLGAAGATVGAFGGYYARKHLSERNPKIAVALVEDAIAIGIGIAVVSRLARSI
jgi:uncharacterized membrane protein